jgi:hypothetical protein
VRKLIVCTTLVALLIPAVAAHAHADSDHDSKQDVRVSHAKLSGGSRTGKTKRKVGWGSGCQRTGYELHLIMPVLHFTLSTFHVHVHWCVHNHQITQYSVYPEDGPHVLWTHWQYDGINGHTINTFHDRVYARFQGVYKMCLSWVVGQACKVHYPTIAITVYNRNKRPAEKGWWAGE